MLTAVIVLIAAAICAACSLWPRLHRSSGKVSLCKPPGRVPISVNYHFTRQCNYACGFCFHTAKTSYIAPVGEAKRGLKLLQEAGMRKLNFAGGEPFLYASFLGKLLKYCKEDLKLESISIVTNGSLVKADFLKVYGKYIDILAVSCDSFNEDTNVKIGRGSGGHLKTFAELSKRCAEFNIKFKVNTVVNKYNFFEDMNDEISRIDPFRWKCFQVLMVENENDSDKTIRDANRFKITDDEFTEFCTRHQHKRCFVPESNAVMKSSYLILDEYMRFLNKGVKEPTGSILDVGVEAAMADVYWDENSFQGRGGIYDWTKAPQEKPSKLDW
ncbi:MAG: hypothetical protein M1837_004342 [Sclerophora amabilis]|nr:MAG: hypothetical protein M1837_004342 [Sclerophora amabilis]